MVYWHIEIRLAGRLRFEIDGQITILNEWIMYDVFNIIARHGIDSIDEMIRFVQTVALGLISW